MKKITRLIVAEILMFSLLAVIVVIGQTGLTIRSENEQIKSHLDEALETVDTYKADEDTAGESLMKILQVKADIMAFALREGIGGPTSKEALARYAKLLGVEAIYIADTKYDHVIISSNDKDVVLSEISGLGANIDGETGVAVELNVDKEVDLFNKSLSWEDIIINTIVGRNGYVFVVNQENSCIVHHPDDSLEGAKIKYLSGNPDNYNDSFGLIEVGEDVLYASLKEVRNRDYFNEYVICGVPIEEIFYKVLWSVLIYLLVFLVITVLFICYIVFSYEQYNRFSEDPLFGRKLVLYSLTGVVVVFCITIFLTRLNLISEYSVSCRTRALDAVNTLEDYNKDTNELQALYNNEYLIKCRMAADILSKSKELNTREDLGRIAKILDVKEIYIYDRNGKVSVTNSPYDHFELSRDEKSQSYDFLPLLDGVEYVIQEPQYNDVSGEWMQYIGVSTRDGQDLADGFVQIAVAPKGFQKIKKSINLSAKLNGISVVNGGFAFAVDGDSGEILYALSKGYVGKNAKELGMIPSQLQDGYNGFININDEKYYASVAGNSDGMLVFVVIPQKDMSLRQWKAAVTTAIISLLCMLILSRIALSFSINKQADPMEDKLDAGRRDSRAESDNRLRMLLDKWGVEEKTKSKERWGRVFLTWSNRLPEEKVLSLIKLILVFISLGAVWMCIFGKTMLKDDSILLYIIEGQWEKGINIFSATACIIIMCVIFITVELIDNILYAIVLISDTKTETICHLLRSLVRYGAIITGLYFCLAQVGVNTRTLAASAGILSIVIGFGAQELVKDIIAGLFIIFENQFTVGDLIRIDGWRGYVTEIGIRTTKVSSYDDVKSFNNSDIRGIENYTVKDVVITYREIAVSYEEDLMRLYKIFEQELPLMKERIVGAVGEPSLFGIVRLDDSAIVMRFELPCKSRSRLSTEAAFYRELLLMFDRNSIEVPYPHLTVASS